MRRGPLAARGTRSRAAPTTGPGADSTSRAGTAGSPTPSACGPRRCPRARPVEGTEGAATAGRATAARLQRGPTGRQVAVVVAPGPAPGGRTRAVALAGTWGLPARAGRHPTTGCPHRQVAAATTAARGATRPTAGSAGEASLHRRCVDGFTCSSVQRRGGAQAWWGGQVVAEWAGETSAECMERQMAGGNLTRRFVDMLYA
mmetsp:Transcript_8403/g.20963  ORF Transcript_8403/g.20963 Transcript_8403/m.20963 type:complete len:202 (+) Transcript_8403:1301-1906(+)